MSKGGNKNNSSSSAPVEVTPDGKPVYPNLPETMTFSAYSPGQQEALTSQMQRGYGTVPEDMQTHMDQTTADMTIPRLHEPITVTQKALESGDWNMPDQNYSTGSFALDALLGLPSAQPEAFTPGGIVSSPAQSSGGSGSGGANNYDPNWLSWGSNR